MVSVELAFHFFSRKICDIGRRLRDRRTIDELHFRNSMVSIELTKYYLMNYPILYAVVLSFSSSGANCPEIGGGNCPDIGGELPGANCLRGELSGYRRVQIGESKYKCEIQNFLFLINDNISFTKLT